MSTLVTLGCSFSEGVGCYDIELFKQYGDIHHEEFVEINTPNFLEGSIGRYIQKTCGFKKYYNYAHGASSNKTQFLKFFNNLPTDDDVTVIWQITFYTRKGGIFNNRLKDWTIATDSWVKEYYNQIIQMYDDDSFGGITTRPYGTFTGIDKDDRIEVAIYISILNEFCKSKGWKFLCWFWESNEFEIVKEIYPKIEECIVPFNRSQMNDKHTSAHITGDGHPNEEGYKLIASDLLKEIDTHGKNFKWPHDTPELWKPIDKFEEISDKYY